MKSLETAKLLRERFGDSVSQPTEFRGEVTVCVTPQALAALMTFCRDELGFDYLVDITSVDHPERDPRFDVVYELARLEDWEHLRIKTTAGEDTPQVPTVTHLWPTANWHEREIYDMMGIRFAGHPDLRRILMWEGYPHHPLLKDFPLEGLPTEIPDVAFTAPAPLAGGPFVTAPTTADTRLREPRARRPGDSPEEPAP